MKFYKVLQRIGGCLYSVSTYDNPLLSVEYRPNVPTFPSIPESKLFIFNGLGHAYDFYRGGEIWECEVRNPFEATNRTFYEDEIIPFWKGARVGFTCSPPLGTYFCDSLILRKQVYHWRWTESLKGDT